MKVLLSTLWAVLAAATSAMAQAPPEPRGVVFAGVGYSRTADDEGLLGAGAALSIGAGLHVTPGLSVQAVFDRIPYHRDEDYLAFDGRVLFIGVEAAFQSQRPRVRPFVTIGAGIMNDQKDWTHRTQPGPGQPRVEGVTTHEYTLAAMRSSGGVDVRLTEALSLRVGLTFHGLLDTGDDLAAHFILQPAIGAAWRW
jgi:Outer membrane protein beta-barrel domain